MVTAAYIAGDFVVIGVMGFYLWRGRHIEFAKAGFSAAMWIAIILTPLQIFLGDMHGRNTLEYQPVKVAAMEGDWDTMRGQPLVLFAWPDMTAQRNEYEIAIPKLGSLILTHDWNGLVKGLKAVPPADQPPVPYVFYAFRLMVGIGILMFLIALAGLVLRLVSAGSTTRAGSQASARFRAHCRSLPSSAAGPSPRSGASPMSSMAICAPRTRFRRCRRTPS